MPSTYKTPGVYIEEVSKFPPSVAAVDTAIPAFIGYTEKAEKNGENLFPNAAENIPPVAVRISSLLDYEKYFGKAPVPQMLNVYLNDENKVEKVEAAPLFYLYDSLKMFYNNGGKSCYIVSVGAYNNEVFDKQDFVDGIDALKKEDEPTLLLFPDAQRFLDTDIGYLQSYALKHCNDLQDRFCIFDVKNSGKHSDPETESLSFRNNVGSSYLKYGAAYYPYIKSIFSYNFSYSDLMLFKDTVEIQFSVISSNPDIVTELETALTEGVEDIIKEKETKLIENDPVYKEIVEAVRRERIVLPPSGPMAGIYASVDRDRGVWKAPANININSVIAPVLKLDDTQQENLNVDTTAGKSINAIRSFTGKGPAIVWGARTLAGNDNEWRYISVRRFFIMAEESIAKATKQFVFEANDANTWVRVRAMIENFLTLQWRAGALAGAKPEHAFYVKIGLGETMTASDIQEGKMIVQVGMAVVRPAEFIVLEFSHKMQES